MDLWTACRAGDAATVAQLLRDDPTLATAKGGPKEREALLDCCFVPKDSDPQKAAGMVECARLLLQAGADPDASFLYDDGHETPGPLSALYGASGYANSPELTQLLLEAGANPNDGESLYHSAEHRDLACCRLLLQHGAKFDGTNALHRMLDFPDLEGLRLFLDHGADPNHRDNCDMNPALHHAIIRGRDVETIELLIIYGADPLALNGEGKSPYALARRSGLTAVAEALLRHGAVDDLTEKERFLAACAAADRQYVVTHPYDVAQLDTSDNAILVEAANLGNVAALTLMLELGFDPAATGEQGATALHCASWYGRAECVRPLLAHKAPLEQVEPTYKSTPIGWAIHGSQACPDPGDYVTTITLLLEAGATLEGVYTETTHLGVAAIIAKHLDVSL